MTSVEIVDPLGSEPESDVFTPAPRPSRLEGMRLGLLDNGKPNAAHVIATLARGLAQDHDVPTPVAVTKPVASRPVDQEVVMKFKGFDAAIVGVGD